MLCDSHTHSRYSFDGHSTAREMCLAALDAGVGTLVITDHYDIDGIMDGFYPAYDAAGAAAEIAAAKEEFASRLSLYRGIEIGQPALRPEAARAFLADNRFDFVIGSCHNLAGMPDFFFLNYTHMPQPLMEDLYRRMLGELCQHAAFPGIHSVAHLTYPLRYMHACGRMLDVQMFEAEFRRLFHVMTESGVALEMNVKGMARGDISPETERYIFRLYKDCGGTEVTVGSDAHTAAEIGGSVAAGMELLREIGFCSVRLPGEHGITHIKI